MPIAIPLHPRTAERSLWPLAYCPLQNGGLCVPYMLSAGLSDDIVDCSAGDAEERLAAWRRKALTPEPPSSDLVTIAWADTRFRYLIPQRYAEQLIDGVGRDLYQTRYHSFEDVVRYAYGVASTVGLMSMHIIGFAGEQAIPYAIKLGIALQITNILRDIGEDWANGRLYLPMDEMAAFGLSEADLDKGQVNEHWRAFMSFQIERNRRLYAEANPGIALLNKDGRFAVAAASDLYRAILSDIEMHDYGVFNRRAHVSAWGKVRRLPRIWWRNRQGKEQVAMKSYDIIILGAGASGLSLASHLAHSPLRDRSILIVEKDVKDKNDRTWCFWANQPTFFDNIVYRSWSQLQVLGEHFEKTLDLHEYRYNMIRGIDFYSYARQTVSECPHVEFLQGRVELIKDGDQQANVLVDGKQYAGTWVFDSLFNWSTFKPDLTHYHAIKQQFKGWEIEASGQPFNPQVATFLDFRTPQENGTHFFYVLPFSEQWALVESVLCTTTPINRELCEQSLQDYLKSILGIQGIQNPPRRTGHKPLDRLAFPKAAWQAYHGYWHAWWNGQTINGIRLSAYARRLVCYYQFIAQVWSSFQSAL